METREVFERPSSGPRFRGAPVKKKSVFADVADNNCRDKNEINHTVITIRSVDVDGSLAAYATVSLRREI